MASRVMTVLFFLYIQGALGSSAIDQCPAGDPSCRAGPDDSTLLQSRVDVALNKAEDDKDEDDEDLSADLDALKRRSLSKALYGKWWNDVADTVSDGASSVGNTVSNGASSVGNAVSNGASQVADAATDGYNSARDTVEDGLNAVADGVTDIYNDGVAYAQETVKHGLATMDNAIMEAQNKVVHFAQTAIDDIKKEAKAVADAAGQFANSMMDVFGDFGRCLDLDKLLFTVMFGGQEGIDTDNSSLAVDLANLEAPKLSAQIHTSLGHILPPSLSQGTSRFGNNPKEIVAWGYGPEMVGPVMQNGEKPLNVTAGASVMFNPQIGLDLEPGSGKVTLTFTGDVEARAFAEIRAKGSHTYDHKHAFGLHKVTGCAGPFCVVLMIQGMVELEVVAEIQGHASAEITAKYGVTGRVEFDASTGDANATYSAGKLTHSEEIQYESSFKGAVSVKAGPLVTIMPLPGAPITIEPWVKAELKAYAKVSGKQASGNAPAPPTCDEELLGVNNAGYRGCQPKTRTGRTCQAWTAQSPHAHSITPANRPDKALTSNYCRNPDNEPTIWCYTTDSNTRWEYCTPVCHGSESLAGSKGQDYRGCQSVTRGGKTCQRWSAQTPHSHGNSPSAKPNKGLEGNNFCRNPDGSRTIWCYTTSDTRWDWCDPKSNLNLAMTNSTAGTELVQKKTHRQKVDPKTLVEFENVKDGEQTWTQDASGFWQTKVEVAADTPGTDFKGIQTGTDKSDPDVCGKAGVNIHAGIRATGVGFPDELNFNSQQLSQWITEELAKMPTKTHSAVIKMIADCLGMPEVSSAMSAFDGVMDRIASEISAVIPAFNISLPLPQELFDMNDACFNVWQDSLPQGHQCSTYNVGCPA